jgi:hypothetical protein
MFSNTSGVSVPIAPVRRGFSSAEAVLGVPSVGFKDLRTRDNGFFGAGLYATFQPSYAREYTQELQSGSTAPSASPPFASAPLGTLSS